MKKNHLRDVSNRFKTKVIDAMEDEIHPVSHKVWIKPLCVVKFENNILTLYHEDSRWVLEHYGADIKEALNDGNTGQEIKVEITNERNT